MGSKRIRAMTAKSARKKATSKNMTVTKVNYIKGSKKGKTGSYRVHTKKKKGK